MGSRAILCLGGGMRARLLVILAAVLALVALAHELYATPVRVPRPAVMGIVALGALCLVAAGAVYEDDELPLSPRRLDHAKQAQDDDDEDDGGDGVEDLAHAGAGAAVAGAPRVEAAEAEHDEQDDQDEDQGIHAVPPAPS